MRRPLALFLAAGLLASVGVAPVSAAPPTHEPFGFEPLSFAAGEICDFALEIENERQIGKQTTAELADGTIRIIQRGMATSTVTNADTGLSVSDAGGFRITITIHPDGSIDAVGSGALYAFYAPGDPSVIGTGWIAISGRVVEHYAADGTYLGNEFSGRSENLCETLA